MIQPREGRWQRRVGEVEIWRVGAADVLRMGFALIEGIKIYGTVFNICMICIHAGTFTRTLSHICRI